jgi:hypothetical protein
VSAKTKRTKVGYPKPSAASVDAALAVGIDQARRNAVGNATLADPAVHRTYQEKKVEIAAAAANINRAVADYDTLETTAPISEIAEAIECDDDRLLRAIGLLSVEIKPGMGGASPDDLAVVRDLLIEVQRSLRWGIKYRLIDAGVLASTEVATAAE